MLFTEQKNVPFLLKAVAHAFYDTMHVGFVPSSEQALVKKYKVSDFPSLIMVRKKNEKPLYFKGELKFNNIFDFLNPYSEKFVFGDVRAKFKEDELKLTKPWLNEEVPELTRASANDVCFNTGKLCVILVDTKDPGVKLKELVKVFKGKYAADNKFSFMWLNAKEERPFFKIFQLEDSERPKLVLLNVGSMKRVLIHNGELTEAEITKTFDSIYGADARFTRVSSKNLPELVVREKKGKSDL